MDEKLYWLGFSIFPGIGPKKFQTLLETFGSAKNAWHASSIDLKNSIGEILSDRFLLFRKSFDLESYAKKLIEKKITFLTLLDEEYPKLLKQIVIAPVTQLVRNDSRIPFLLYLKGNVSLLNADRTIAIVGTRKITPYGREVTKFLTEQLVQQNFVIVSGLALGVDAIVHTETVQNHGKTIAVLGCGVDCCTPSSNQTIYNSILDSGGTIISAFPPGTKASKGSFPARNSIIAGLSLGVLVTEGAEDSGALITAQKAKEFGRNVFAVPGPITSSLSRGANSLLQNGAVAVTDANNILKKLKLDAGEWKLGNETRSLKMESLTSSFNHQKPSSSIQYPASKEEQEIINMLQLEALHIDQIVRKVGKDAKSVGSLLSLMEIKGLINSNGGVYSL